MPRLPAQLPHAFPEFDVSLHRLFCTHRGFHKLSTVPKRVRLLEEFGRKGMAGGYEGWSQQQLIARIQELELQASQSTKITTTNPEEPNSATFTSFPIPASSESSKSLAHREGPKPRHKAFDASKYNTRLIALKFAYLGQKYNGFEHHKNNTTPLPTIEEEVWKALVKTRLINPIPTKGDSTDYSKADRGTFATWDREGADVNWDGTEYSKCGRTDRGVSAFGQVIGVRVRSNRPLPKTAPTVPAGDSQEPGEAIEPSPSIESETSATPFNDLTDEFPYIQVLNRVLPPTIRMYAWCPNPPPNFSARFSCKERRYKYFFTNPCFPPVPGLSGVYQPKLSDGANSAPMREGWLDIPAMQEACGHLVGLHDFRNFCKIDASKQLSNFKRRIFHASIDEVSPLSLPSFLSHSALQPPSSSTSSQSSENEAPKIYAFTLHGSAFLWHQVRSIVAILFHIGQRLESPSLVPALLDIEANPSRPRYEMASDAPLVLWDCIFPHAEEVRSTEEREHGYEDRLEWIYVGDEGAAGGEFGASGNGGASLEKGGKFGRAGILDDIWETWHKAKIDETLSALLLDRVASQGKVTLNTFPTTTTTTTTTNSENGAKGSGAPGMMKLAPRVFEGANQGKAKGAYQQILNRKRNESVEVLNERYRLRKGPGWRGPVGKRRAAAEGNEYAEEDGDE